MSKCPYCQNEMKKGFVEGDGRLELNWVPEHISPSPLSRTLSDFNSCITLCDVNWLKSMSRVKADYCENCKKIIIDIG